MNNLATIITAILFLLFFSGPTLAADFSPVQICRAGIAVNNGRAVSEVLLAFTKGDLIQVAYYRDDGKAFTYACKILSSEIKWRDLYMDRWSKNIRIHYSISADGKGLTIKTSFAGDPMSTKSFTLSDFQ